MTTEERKTDEWEIETREKAEYLLQIVWSHKHGQECEWLCPTAKRVADDMMTLFRTKKAEWEEAEQERVLAGLQNYYGETHIDGMTMREAIQRQRAENAQMNAQLDSLTKEQP